MEKKATYSSFTCVKTRRAADLTFNNISSLPGIDFQLNGRKDSLVGLCNYLKQIQGYYYEKSLCMELEKI